MRAVLSAMLAFGLAGPAVAGDLPINKDVIVKDLDRAFEQAAADLKTMTVIYNGECEGSDPVTCTFDGQGQLAISSSGPTEDSPATMISIFYRPDGDPNPLVLNVGLLVSVCEPTMKQDDRAKIIVEIINKMAKGLGEVKGVNARYTTNILDGAHFVIAEKAEP